MANGIIKKVTVTKTTNSDGILYGSSNDLFGVRKAIIVQVYLQRDNYAVYRSVSVNMYGSEGYSLTFKSNNTAIANSDVTFDVYYI